jgi:hypothetical protein
VKLTYLLLADAANKANGKVNALGIGFRRIETVLPALIRAVVLISVELGPDEEVDQAPVKLVLERPGGSKDVIAEGTTSLTRPKEFDERLPLYVNGQWDLGHVAVDEYGLYRLRVQLGKVRGEYRFVVDSKTEQRAIK